MKKERRKWIRIPPISRTGVLFRHLLVAIDDGDYKMGVQNGQ
jgi:hypothetical protein